VLIGERPGLSAPDSLGCGSARLAPQLCFEHPPRGALPRSGGRQDRLSSHGSPASPHQWRDAQGRRTPVARDGTRDGRVTARYEE
jgi:hypothetical protein